MVAGGRRIPPFCFKKEKSMARTHFRILWRNTATKTVLAQSAVNTSESKMYYRFPVPAGLEKGEYEYYVIADGGNLVIDANDPRKSTVDGEPVAVLDCGIAQVGEIGRDTQSYAAAKNYKFYES